MVSLDTDSSTVSYWGWGEAWRGRCAWDGRTAVVASFDVDGTAAATTRDAHFSTDASDALSPCTIACRPLSSTTTPIDGRHIGTSAFRVGSKDHVGAFVGENRSYHVGTGSESEGESAECA